MPEDCKFCCEADMMILPLRYAVLNTPGPQPLPLASAAPLWSELNAIKLTPWSRYTVRPVRPGFVYVLLRRGAVKSWQAYAVTKGAELYSFPAAEPPGTPPEFSCDRDTCGINASMIKIADASKVVKAWMLFTPNPLTPGMLKKIKAEPDSFPAMQAFSPADWLKGNRQQPHCLEADKLPEQIAEMQVGLAPPSELRDNVIEALNMSLFPPYEDALVEKPMPGPKKRKETFTGHVGHLKNLQKKLKENNHPAFILCDSIGITQELNAWRNEPMERFHEWLGERNRDEKNGPTNEHRMLMLGQIEDMEITVKESVKITPYSDAEIMEAAAWSQGLYARGCSGEQVKQEMDKFWELKRKNREGKAKKESAELWNDIAGKYLDAQKMEKFKAEMKRKNDVFESSIINRASHHLAWLESKQFADALDVYDPAHSGSGIAYQDQVGVAVVGMDYTEKGRALVDKWIKDLDIGEGNHLMRAYCYKQDEIIKEFRKAAKVAQNGPELNDPKFVEWFNETLYGMPGVAKEGTENKVDPGAWVDAPGEMKKLVKHFDTIGKAISESTNQGWLTGSLFGRGVAVQGVVASRLFGFAARPMDARITRALLSSLPASLGRWAVLCKMSDREGNLRNPAARQAALDRETAKAHQRVQLAGEDWRTNTSIRGNYFRVRTGVTIMVLESLNLLFHAYKDHEDTDSKLVFAAAALATAAAGFELAGFGYRTVGRALVDNPALSASDMTARAAAAGYGGMKLLAGSTALFASGIGAYLSFVTSVEKWKEWRGAETNQRLKGTLFGAYAAHTVSSIGFAFVSFGTAFADTAAFFKLMSRNFRGRALGNMFGGLSNWAKAVNGARGAGKAMLYRFGAYNVWVFVGLSLLIWALEYYNLNELQEWCARSSFKRDRFLAKKGEYFFDYEEEHEELLTALKKTFPAPKEGSA